MVLARVIVVAVLAALSSVYVLAGAPGAVLVFAVQCLYTLWSRTWWLLAAQAVLVSWVTLGAGSSVVVLGYLAGSLLVTRLRALAPAVVLGAVVLAYARSGDVATTLDLAITTVLMTLIVPGLIRLVERVDELHATRLALAAAAVGEERLRIAAELSDGLGRGLATITEGVRRALAQPPAPEPATQEPTTQEPAAQEPATGRAPDDRAADDRAAGNRAAGDRAADNAGGRTAADLGEVVGAARRSLADARAAAASYRAMSLTPELATARAMLAADGVTVEVRAGHTEPLGPAGSLLATVLREAVTDVVRRGTARTCLIETDERAGTVRLRLTDDGRRTAEDDALAELPARVKAAGGRLTAGLSEQGRHTVEATLPAPDRSGAEPARADLSVLLLAAVLIGFSLKGLLQIPPALLPLAAALLGVIVVMQVRSVDGRHMVALAAMAVLTFAPIPVFGPIWLGVPGFLAGPVLLAFRPRTAWPLVAAIVAATGVIAAAYRMPPGQGVNVTVSALVTGLVIYSLLRLARLAKQLQAAREGLARAAVVEERLRAARDLHDLLGHSLAAILLKCELARRLPPERARAELAEVLELAGRAEHDLRSVSGEQRDLSLAAEADSARSVLRAARVEVTADLAHPPLPAEVETVLSAVLREAVTNVLRHSSARHCEISTAAEGDRVRLSVRNDGARPGEARRGSSGLGNLSTRLAALDGRLATEVADGWFRLDACAPYRAASDPAGHRAASDPAGHREASDPAGHREASDPAGHRAASDPAGLGGDAHGVGTVAGV
ncbi:sensor histidine kinase [Nonomuraea candida]|uniref:sensor histidine kinase n=1 Tax=Nonomuraea candida TaxID=359159 RepID=UPI0007C7C90D|nr:histidine kinase [Nonomuraea candida]